MKQPVRSCGIGVRGCCLPHAAALLTLFLAAGCASLETRGDSKPAVSVARLAFPQPKLKSYGAIYFGNNSAALTPEARAFADQLAAYLKLHFRDRVRLEGHASASGAPDHNRKIAQQRADAVKEVLIANKIDPTRIEALSLGEAEILSANEAENRCVSIILVERPE